MKYSFLFFLSVAGFGATITSNTTGNWNTGSTWVGGVAPGNGDSAVIANGHTVTIPVGVSVTVGTSPANDTGTAAIACSSTSGSGKLVVNGTLIYRGPVRLCDVTTFGAGATVTHDSSAASTPSAAHYSWQQAQINGRTTSVLNINGSSGSRVTINKAGGSGDSGGFQSPSINTTDGGQVVGAYFDITAGCGTPGGTWCMYSYLSSASDQFYIHDCTITGSGALGFGGANGAATLRIEDCAIKTSSPLTDSAIKLVEFGVTGNSFSTPRTTGTRRLVHNFFDGGYVYITTLWGANKPHIGLTIQRNWMSIVSTTVGPFRVFGPPIVDAGEWSDNLMWTTGLPAHPDWNIPSGYPTRTYSLADAYSGTVSGSPLCNSSSVNYHWSNINAPVVIDHFIYEAYCGGTVSEPNAIEVAGNGNETANFAVTIQNVLTVPGSDNRFGNVVDYDNTTTANCGVSIRCPIITLKQSTVSGEYAGNPCGLGAEIVPPAGTFTGNYDNIYFRSTSGDGCIERAPGSVQPPNGTFTGTHDYNWKWNLVATTQANLYRWGSTAAYSATPGTHDSTGNPSFQDSTRNFLKWAQTIDPTVSTWLDVKAKFATIGTTAYNSSWSIPSLIDYVFTGWTPTNTSTFTASSTGAYVGAVVPPSVTVSPSSLSFTCTSGGSVPGSSNVTVGAVGIGITLDNWSATKTQSWLTVAPTSGTSAGSFAVSVDCTGLAVGSYSDNITVSSTTTGLIVTSKIISVSVTAIAGPAIDTTSLSNGVATVAYSQTLSATGGQTPYTWSIASGSLCAGLSINASTGAITGTPTAVGTCSFTARVTDSNLVAGDQALSVLIQPLPRVTGRGVSGRLVVIR